MSVTVSAQSDSFKTTSYFMCRNQSIVRTLRIETSEQEGCRTIYTKQGIDKVVASGRNSYTCVSIRDNVKGNLESAGWTCRDISSAKISESPAN